MFNFKACQKVVRSGASIDFDDETQQHEARQYGQYPRASQSSRYATAVDLERQAPQPPTSTLAPKREPPIDRGERGGAWQSAAPTASAKAKPATSSVLSACVKPCMNTEVCLSIEADEKIAYPRADEYPRIQDVDDPKSSALPMPAIDDAPLEDPGYALLEADSSDEEFEARTRKFVRQFSEVNREIGSLRMIVGVLLFIAASLVATLACLVYNGLSIEHKQQALEWLLLASIPIVACLFTWFHIWMAIQMMFRPLKFIGLWQYKNTGTGIGWQGVIPRKAGKMAATGYACAREFIMGARAIMNSVPPQGLVSKVRSPLSQVIEGALSAVGQEHFPWVDSKMPAHTKRKIAEQAVERIIESSPQLWAEFTELLSDPDTGIDNDGMMVKVFTENKELLNTFFLTLGEKEFRFIEHCGAVMGFVCGVVQLIAFNNLSQMGRNIFLPTSGFFLGIFSNWLAIQMVFRPTDPIPVRLFGFHLYDIQGLFIKRQNEVCELYAKMVVENFLSFEKILEYLQTKDELWKKLQTVYLEHNTRIMKDTLGVVATWLTHMGLGQEKFDLLEESMKTAMVRGLYDAKDIHKIAARYIGKVTGLEKKNCLALQRMPPAKFEQLLHPVFQEDEWILVLLGGVLGVIVGLGQIYFLTS